jgi:DNA polymerase III epsilon subunit-like protein
MTVVYFDLETGGLDMGHPIIQAAAVAVDGQGRELGSLNLRLKFDEAAANPEALALNHYKRELWEEAIAPTHAVAAFASFLNEYKCVENISKRTGRPYRVARLGGYNASTFDYPRLKRLFDGAFLPADPRVLDVMQLAFWYFQWHPKSRPSNLRLATVCEHFGIPLEGAHDALEDVRATAKLALTLKEVMHAPTVVAPI